MYLLIALILSVIVIAIYFSRGKNAVWGGATLGIIVGVIVGFFNGDFLVVLGWGFSLGTLVGLAAELMGGLSDRLRDSDGYH
tara:strand:+ start:1809 stop:2054 length:246 start_codon:yes stop_codon:yes gene_type:complete